MRSTDALFDLIKSLSVTERGYFRKYARINSGSASGQHLLLFGLMEKQRRYDEVELRRALQRHNLAGHLAEAKYYLHRQVMRSLQSFHSRSSADMKLADYLQQIEILYVRSLFSHALSTVRKAKKLAYRFEKYNHLTALLAWESMAYRRLATPDFTARLKAIIREEKEALRRQQLRLKFAETGEMVYASYRKKGHVRSRREVAHFSRAMEELRKMLPTLRGSFLLKRIFYGGLHIYYNHIGDLDRSYRISRKTIRLYEANADRLGDRLELAQYVLALNQYIVACSRVDRLGEMEEYLERLGRLKQSVPKKSLTPDVALRITEVYFAHRYDVFLRRKEHHSGVAFVENTLPELKRYLGVMDKSYETVILSNIGCIYLGAGEYGKAQTWFRRLAQGPYRPYRQDVFSLMRIYELIIHLELGHYDLLQSLVVSAYRFLLKHRRLFRLEEYVLQFLRRAVRFSPGDERFTEELRRLHARLLPLRDDQFEREAFYDFDFIDWLEGKINPGKPRYVRPSRPVPRDR